MNQSPDFEFVESDSVDFFEAAQNSSSKKTNSISLSREKICRDLKGESLWYEIESFKRTQREKERAMRRVKDWSICVGKKKTVTLMHEISLYKPFL